MTKVMQPCAYCSGTGIVVHQARTLAADEIRAANDLDRFKPFDICEMCSGAGRRAYEIQPEEHNPSPAP